MRYVLAIALAAGLIAAGCGGDDDGDTLTKEEYISQADANCKKADKELDQSQGPQGANGLDEFVTGTLVPNIQGQVDFVQNLDGPEEVEDEVNPILDDAQAAIDQLEKQPSQLENGAAARDLQQAGQDLQEYGFEECGG